VTVTNLGNQPTGALAVLLSGADSSDFTLSASSLNSLAVGSDDALSIAPKTGLGIGTHTAAVTVSGDHGITAGFGVSFTVLSSDPAFIPVTGLELSFTSITLTLGDSQTLDALITPDDATSKDVDWIVIDSVPLSPDLYPLVVKIEPNNVTVRDRTCTSSNTQALAAATRRLTATALGPGTATIRATALDGGFTADCPVVVNPSTPAPPVPPVPPVSPDLPPEYEVVSPDVITEEPVIPDPETVPPCTLPLEDEGTEYIGEMEENAASVSNRGLRPNAADVPAYEAERRFFLDRAALGTILELIRMRTGQTIPADDVIAAPNTYLDDLFKVLLFQQEVAEGPHEGDYVWLVPGVAEPAEAVRLGIVKFSSSGSDGIEAVLRFFVADDVKGVKFLNGQLIVGDGLKNGKLTDLVWLNARAPSGGSEIDGGSGCSKAGRAAGPAPFMGLLAAGLLVFLRRKKA
jgi:hypothetical protein